MTTEISDNELDRLLLNTADHGCETAVYELAKGRVMQDKALLEDQRVADWIYMTSLDLNGKALTIGCGLGTLPISLSRTCQEVIAVDCERKKVEFLKLCIKQRGLANLEAIHVEDVSKLSLAEAQFDLISLSGPLPQKSGDLWPLVEKMHALLKEGGVLHLSLDNKWAFQNLLGLRWMSGGHTLSGTERRLGKIGFDPLRFYAPLPHPDGIPLFYLPLKNSGAIHFFLENLFPLFEMVSPEARRRYALPYAISKIGVRAARALHLTSLAGHFVPGFTVLASKRSLQCFRN
ncbi:MAG: class I SAM-dependent methyltransferase [Deltaproteobacteria bacterium]|nr:class I SAM-dependent methyltransferase [Deltaproteobacteria bacterium]